MVSYNNMEKALITVFFWIFLQGQWFEDFADSDNLDFSDVTSWWYLK